MVIGHINGQLTNHCIGLFILLLSNKVVNSDKAIVTNIKMEAIFPTLILIKHIF